MRLTAAAHKRQVQHHNPQEAEAAEQRHQVFNEPRSLCAANNRLKYSNI